MSNGRSHGNVVQTWAESSSLLECNAECRRHSWNEIQKQRFSLSHEQRKLAYYAMTRKYLANEDRAKFTWAMLSAARYSCNKTNSETKEISRKRIQSQVYLNYVECSRNSLSKISLELFAWFSKNAYTKTHLKVHRKASMKFPWEIPLTQLF